MPGLTTISPDTYTYYWLIENTELISLKCSPKNINLSSSEFSFQTIESTKWWLKFYQNRKDDKFIDFEIHRFYDDSSLEFVHFNCEVSIADEDYILHEKKLNDISLQQSTAKKLENFIETDLFLNYCNHKNLKIVFKMILCKKMYKTNNHDGELLALDLQKLYKNDNFCNLTILTPSGSVPAHLFVVKTRWPELLEELEQTDQGLVCRVNISTSTVKAILRYVYCGQLDSLYLNKDLFMEADQNNVLELVSHFKKYPTKVSVRPRHRIVKATITWLLDIKDFDKWDNKVYIKYVYLGSFLLLTVLEVSNCENELKFDINFNFINFCQPIFFEAQTSFIVDERLILFSLKLRNAFVEEKVYSRSFLLEKSKLLPSQKKKFVCVVTAGQKNPLFDETESTVDICNVLPNVAETVKLRTDLETIFAANENFDVNVECRGLYFQTHAAILSSRSKRFEEMIQVEKTPGLQCTIRVTDIEYPILELIVRYIYGIHISKKDIINCAKQITESSDNVANNDNAASVDPKTFKNTVKLLHEAFNLYKITSYKSSSLRHHFLQVIYDGKD